MHVRQTQQIIKAYIHKVETNWWQKITGVKVEIEGLTIAARDQSLTT